MWQRSRPTDAHSVRIRLNQNKLIIVNFRFNFSESTYQPYREECVLLLGLLHKCVSEQAYFRYTRDQVALTPTMHSR